MTHHWRTVRRETLTEPAEYEYVSGEANVDVEIDGVTWDACVHMRPDGVGGAEVESVDDVTRDGEPWDEPLPAKVRAEIEERAMRSVSR